MSHYDYERSKEVGNAFPFYALIMAAARKADSTNFQKLKMLFPDVIDELQRRYDAPGGILPEDESQE